MSREQRISLIKKLQEIRNSKIICHVTSDRRAVGIQKIPGLSTQIAGESFPYFSEHFLNIGHNENLDLFLYTRGGNVDAVWPLVNLFREHAKCFSVLVPFYAHSAGTLICLGANKIVMGEMGQLSPVDPTTSNPFNPIDSKTQTQKPISVEDVMAYLDLATEKFELNSEEARLSVFQELTEKVEPLALGNVYRAFSHIRLLAEKLLRIHFQSNEDSQIKNIVTTLTEEFSSHTHAINRGEAQKVLGERIVKFASEQEERFLWDLWSDYEEELKLKEPFSIAQEVGRTAKDITLTGGFIESENLSHIFQVESHVIPVPQVPSNIQIQIPAEKPFIHPSFPIQYSIEQKFAGWKTYT